MLWGVSLQNLTGKWCRMHRLVPSFSVYFFSGCFLHWRRLMLFLLSCFCRLKRLFPVRFVCLEGMSKKFTETKMSIKYRSSLEGRYAVHILPHSNEKLPLRYLNQLINPYYINYDDEKLIIAYWPKNKCKSLREIFKAGWWPQSNILQKSAGGTKQNWVVTAGKNKSINFLGHFQRWWQNCQPSLGN